MTTVVGLCRGGKVWIAADNQVNFGSLRIEVPGQKVFKFADLIFGVSGDSYNQQVLLTHAGTVKRLPEMTDYRYIVAAVDTWREALNMVEASTTDEGKRYISSGALIGYKGNLYILCSDFSVIPIDRGYHAIGSGGEVALGALEALRSMTTKPENLLSQVIGIAAMHDVWTGNSYTILSDGDEQTEAKRQLNGTSQSRVTE